jgi:hypothetical protein
MIGPTACSSLVPSPWDTHEPSTEYFVVASRHRELLYSPEARSGSERPRRAVWHRKSTPLRTREPITQVEERLWVPRLLLTVMAITDTWLCRRATRAGPWLPGVFAITSAVASRKDRIPHDRQVALQTRALRRIVEVSSKVPAAPRWM